MGGILVSPALAGTGWLTRIMVFVDHVCNGDVAQPAAVMAAAQ